MANPSPLQAEEPALQEPHPHAAPPEAAPPPEPLHQRALPVRTVSRQPSQRMPAGPPALTLEVPPASMTRQPSSPTSVSPGAGRSWATPRSGADSPAPPSRAVRTSTSLSLLGDTKQPWGYPSWIERELGLADGDADPATAAAVPAAERRPPPIYVHAAADDSALVQSGTAAAVATPQIRARRSMTSVLQGFRISRILSEATLSTIPLYADAGEHAPARKTASTLSARDVKLLVCLGDSLLTGLCVTAHPGSVKNKVLAALASRPTHSLIVPWMISGEHRNNTCISGGGDGVVSVGRLLKVFSPAIVGLTQHKTYLFSRGSGFNFARSGSTVDGLVEQVHRFVSKLRRPEFCILENHWKLIYIWIGANDVFSRPIDEISRTFEANLVKALQTLRTLVPRAFTCVLTMPNLSRAHVVNTEKRRDLIARKTKLVNDLIRKVVAEYAWNDSEEFRVALQPIPDDEITEDQYGQFISELDGIHPNYLAQQLFAKCIWNNLWLPPERKLTRLADIIQAPWAKPEPSQYIM